MRHLEARSLLFQQVEGGFTVTVLTVQFTDVTFHFGCGGS